MDTVKEVPGLAVLIYQALKKYFGTSCLSDGESDNATDEVREALDELEDQLAEKRRVLQGIEDEIESKRYELQEHERGLVDVEKDLIKQKDENVALSFRLVHLDEQVEQKQDELKKTVDKAKKINSKMKEMESKTVTIKQVPAFFLTCQRGKIFPREIHRLHI